MRSAPRSSRADEPAFKVVGLTLIALLLLAFFLVCSLQVRKAEARRVAAQVHQSAFSDCLQYVVNSTIGGCVSRLGAGRSAVERPGEAEPLDITVR